MRRTLIGTLAALALAACGDGGDDNTPGDGGGSEPRTPEEVREARQKLLDESDDHDFADPPATTDEDCDVVLEATGEDDADALIEAIEEAESYTTLCLSPGTYAMNTSVVISSARGLAIKGIGNSPEDTVLDFAGHRGDKGFDVTTPGFWIENLYLKNTTGNGVEVKADGRANDPSVFRKLKVDWDVDEDADTDCSEDDPRRDHGAYAVYPTRSSYVIVEFCEVEGASDAGLYVGQVEHGIVRHNSVHGNVAGLEVENSEDVVVYDNEAYDNSGGILALQEPGLTRLDNEDILIRDNDVHDNNGCNFAKPNTTVSNIPSGTGLMAFAGHEIEFRDNDVRSNTTTGLLVVSNVLLDMLNGEEPDYPEDYDPYAHEIYVNGNTFEDNATETPDGAPGDLWALTNGFEDVTWDGFVEGDDSAEDAEICLSSEPPTFVDLTGGVCADAANETAFGVCVLQNHSKETTAHECEESVDAMGF